jgi:phosphatidylglycerol:prolipoprotein diacylglycerol transferase
MLVLRDIHPAAVAFDLGPLSVRWYGLIMATALIIGLIIALNFSKKRQIAKEHLYNLFFLLVVFGVLGGRLAHVITDWGFYRQNWAEVFKIWQGGLAFHGVALAGLLVVIFYGRRKKILFWALTDVIVLAVPLMQAIGRWGNYFNQELFGRPTDAAWGIPIDLANRPAGFGQFSYFHPLFLYESFLDLIIFAVLLALFRKGGLKTGRLTLLYFIFYSIVRFSLDFLRIAPASLGPLSWGQWVSIVLVAGAILCWIVLEHKEKPVTDRSRV